MITGLVSWKSHQRGHRDDDTRHVPHDCNYTLLLGFAIKMQHDLKKMRQDLKQINDSVINIDKRFDAMDPKRRLSRDK